MNMYKVIGRPRAGSLIAEFLLTEAEERYEFEFISGKESKEKTFLALNPLGQVPVLICPNGNTIFETLAITTHLVETFPQLSPSKGSYQRDLQWQYLSLIATCIYSAYHRQNYSHYYAPVSVSKEVGELASAQRDTAYSYLEKVLDPYLLGKEPKAADFYLYMVTRWDPNIKELLVNKPNLDAFIANMRINNSVKNVLNSHR